MRHPLRGLGRLRVYLVLYDYSLVYCLARLLLDAWQLPGSRGPLVLPLLAAITRDLVLVREDGLAEVVLLSGALP